jgi:anti-anti-sigma regulatory factor
MEVLKTALFGVPVLEVIADVDHLTAPTLEDIVQQALALGSACLLLDLSACPYLDSGALEV